MIIKCIYDSFVYDVDLNLRFFVDFLRIYVLLHPLFLIITTVILYTAGKIDRACELKFERLGKDSCQFVGLLDGLVVETGGKQRLHNIIINGVNRVNQCER